MKRFLLIILPFISLTTFGQRDSGFTNKAEAKNLMVNGSKEGKWVEYGDTTAKATEIKRVIKSDGAEVTTTSITEPPGLYYSLTIYKKGKPVGMIRGYYKSGNLQSKRMYNNGIQKEYYESGILKSEYTLKKGVITGVEKIFYSWGEPELETQWVNGKKEGVEKNYYKSGVVKSEVPYIDGKISGPTKYYTEDGWLNEEEPISDNGTINGVVKNYDKNGKVTHETSYKESKLDGVEKLYDENFDLRYEKTYVNGEKTLYRFYIHGKVKYEIHYKDGKEEKTIKFDENGNEIK